jgi:hypothetical protein
MNCQRFENVVGDLARNQMMEADIRESALVHSSECDDCAQRLRIEEKLTQDLRALVAEMSSLAASPTLEPKLLEAFRARPVLAPVVVKRSFQRSVRRYWVAAAAAVLLIFFGVMMMTRWRANVSAPPQFQAHSDQKSGSEQKPEENKSGTSSPTPINVSVPEQPKRRVERPKRQRNEFVARDRNRRSRPSERPTERPTANHVVDEVATEFMPVGYMSVSNLQEGGQIVRVEVPRSKLVSFGLPVNMERSHEKVKADILVGVDGLARAIRFVQVVERN